VRSRFLSAIYLTATGLDGQLSPRHSRQIGATFAKFAHYLNVLAVLRQSGQDAPETIDSLVAHTYVSWVGRIVADAELLRYCAMPST